MIKIEAYATLVAFNALGLDPSLAWRVPREIVNAAIDLIFWRGRWHFLIGFGVSRKATCLECKNIWENARGFGAGFKSMRISGAQTMNQKTKSQRPGQYLS